MRYEHCHKLFKKKEKQLEFVDTSLFRKPKPIIYTILICQSVKCQPLNNSVQFPSILNTKWHIEKGGKRLRNTEN